SRVAVTMPGTVTDSPTMGEMRPVHWTSWMRVSVVSAVAGAASTIEAATAVADNAETTRVALLLSAVTRGIFAHPGEHRKKIGRRGGVRSSAHSADRGCRP